MVRFCLLPNTDVLNQLKVAFNKIKIHNLDENSIKMKNIIIFLLSMIPFLFSCEKDENKVSAGKFDSSFIYQEFSPALELKVVRNGELKVESDSDSIDIDFDNTYDLYFTLHEPEGLFHYFQLQILNEFELAICKEIYFLGHGQSATAIFIDTLTLSDRIDKITDWSGKQTNKIFYMWQANPGGGMTPSYGSWFYVNEFKYIGLSKSGKYGWLEVDAQDPHDVKILRCAFQK